jgi:LysM repeat protein
MSFASLSAQKKQARVVEYIEQYANLAVKQMEKYKVPASITLAQGIIESGSGKSDFAQKSNNHFGIKCGSRWTGTNLYKDDDKKNECFRVYNKPEDSFEDHSVFLVSKDRYSGLFQLKITDYKAWAAGLQSAGYATDKAYANKLIKVIEDYELYKYDTKLKGKSKLKPKSPSNPVQLKRDIYKTHGLIYVIADSNDSFDKIAEDTGFKVKDLIRYNEVPEDFPLIQGDIIYLEKKKKKANKPYFEHIVQIGESMHSISQKYGLQLSSLYKFNQKKEDYVPEEGDILKLR